jgi:chromate transporter
MDWLTYFLLFLKSALLSTGGFGPLPILHDDFISRGWASERQFTEALGVGQISPGPNGLWVVSFGYLTGGLPGAMLALLGILLPPFAVLLVQRGYQRVGHLTATKGFTDGMALAIGGAGLVIFAKLFVVEGIDVRGLLIFAGAFGLALLNRVPVVVVIGLAAVAGVALY